MNKYRFWMEVRDELTGEVTHLEWTGLTLTAAKVMYKATEKNYGVAYNPPLESFGWKLMK